jgi:hypothetical protein
VKSIIVYADESGTHDETGKEKGSEYPMIAGFAAPASEWSKFRVEWQAVLKAYHAPYFHFREWAAASAVIRGVRKPAGDFQKNPYRTWDLKKLDKFRETLGKIVSRGNKVLIAGAIKRLDEYHEYLKKVGVKPDEVYPFEFCMRYFFIVYYKETLLRWGNFKASVNFVFEQNSNPKWDAAMHQTFNAFQKIDTRLVGISFGEKTNPLYLPLQAADMAVSRLHQMADTLADDSPNCCLSCCLISACNLSTG